MKIDYTTKALKALGDLLFDGQAPTNTFGMTFTGDVSFDGLGEMDAAFAPFGGAGGTEHGVFIDGDHRKIPKTFYNFAWGHEVIDRVCVMCGV